MTVSLRAALPSQLRNSLAAVRSRLLPILLLPIWLLICGGFASAQSLSPGGPVEFGLVQIGNTSGTSTLSFFAPSAGITIQSVTAVTGGAPNKDFAVVSNTCKGYLHSPSTCTIELSFSPTQLGIRLGALNITDINNKITNTVYLSGVGVGPQFVFAPTAAVITASSSALSPANFKAGAAVLDGEGNLFFTDVTNGRILERSALNVYSQIATLPVTGISGIAMDGTGTLYVSVGSSVYSFMPGSTPQVFTLPSSITLGTPAGLAIDLAQDLYIADNTKNVIYQIPLGSNTGGTLAITGSGVPLSGPAGLAVDASNNLYVADSGHDRIVEIPLGSLVSSVVSFTSLTLSNPTGVSVDAAGTIYIANTGGSNVIESTVTGTQFVLTETPNPFTLVTPADIVIQPNGDLVISDTSQGLVDVARSAPAVNFPTATQVGTLDATDDPEHLTVQSSGNIPAALALSPTTTNPSISTNAFLLATTSSCPILAAGAPVTPSDTFVPGEVCTYDLNFKPTVVGLNSANLILATTAASGALTASTTVPLTGNGLSTIKSFSLVATPSTINKGGTVQLILTALNADGTTVATDYVGTVTFTTTDSTGLFLFGTSPNTNSTTFTFTAANAGVLNVTPGLQLNQYGVYTAHATDGTYSATSNNIFVVEPATVSLTSSINPSLVNQSTTFTLTVATTGTLTPTGSVTFFSNGVQIGSPVTLTPAGTASISDSFPAAGNYAITATYTPTSSTQGGTASLTQVVGLPTAVTLTSTINPSLVNQSTTLTANISAIATPTGTVTFYNGSTPLGTVPVTGTTATLSVSFPTAGTFPLTAVYNTTSTNPDVTSATSPILDQVVQNTSSMTLTSSVNPSQLNQSTTLTANLAALGNHTGTVTFYDGSTLLGTATITGAAASITVSFTTSGTHNLKAAYSGDTLTQPATATLAQTVLSASTLTLGSSVNPSLVGQSTTLTASLSTSTTPTGTVKFYDGATLLGTQTVTGAVTTFTVSFATVGTHPLTAVYSGDATNAPATSAVLNQIVQNTSSLTFTSSVNPSQPNQATTLTANLTALGTPTGTLMFYDGPTLLGTVNLSGPTASITVSFATPGTHILKAVYSGDALTASSTAILAQTVLNFSTVLLTSSINPSLVGQPTTFTAILNAPGTPTGTVKFYDGATLLGTQNLVGNAAILSASFATVGTHPITAVYSGDANTTPGTSAVLSQVVLNVTSITLTSSVNPSQLNQSTTLTADLSALGSPTGTVKFYDGTTLLGTQNLTGSLASLAVSFTTSGTHNLKAVYSGDVNTSPATATLAQIVLNLTTVTLSTSVNPVLINANTTLTSTVTSAGTPTGTVTFYAGANKLGTATLTGGIASLAASFPTAGIFSLTAVYSGDANNQTATSAPISQTVLNIASVALTTSINPVLLDNPVILSAILTSTGPAPTGTVSFFDGATPLGVAALVNGTASVSASFVYAGTHTITALYSGDAVTASSSAPALSETVADFSFAVASGTSSSASTLAGGTTGYSLLLTPLITTTLPSAVTFTVTGLPSTATFVLTPASVAAGSGAAPVALNITAAQIVAAIQSHLPPSHRSPARYAPIALAFLALPLAWFRRRKRFGSLLASVCLLLAITGGLTGCISDPATGYYGQTPQTYNVTVTATSGSLARATYLTLTVQ